jgi:hypothetical protein
MVTPFSRCKTKTIPSGELLWPYFFKVWKNLYLKTAIRRMKPSWLTHGWHTTNSIIQNKDFLFLLRLIIYAEGTVAKASVVIAHTKRKKIRAEL